MEKIIESFNESLNNTFRLSEKDWKMYSPLTLAYIGDAVYEIVVRTIFVNRANCQPQKLHQKVTSCVSAKAQKKMMETIRPMLSTEEEGVFRRGKNSKPHTKAKNASMGEYLDATGFESLVGYLYLMGRYDRMNELIASGLATLGVIQEKE